MMTIIVVVTHPLTPSSKSVDKEGSDSVTSQEELVKSHKSY